MSVPFPTEPDLTPRDAATLAGLSYYTVLQLIRTGRLRAYRRPGGRFAIRREDYMAWAYGDVVEPRRVEPAVAEPVPVRRGGRGRPVRGSVVALRAIESEGGER